MSLISSVARMSTTQSAESHCLTGLVAAGYTALQSIRGNALSNANALI